MLQDSKKCDRAVDTRPTTIRYVIEYYKTQKMCNEAVDDSLAVLKLIPA